VNLELRQGEVVLLRGENGSGKTTLLNVLTGNLEPDAGIIEYSADGSPRKYAFPRRWWQQLNPWDHFRPEFVAEEGIGRTWQDVRLFNSQSLRDNIAVAVADQPGENPLLAVFAPTRVRRIEKEVNAKANAILSRLNLTGLQASSADKISLGEAKRVAMARVLAGGSRILFLDEPLAGLDRRGIANVLELLESLIREHAVTVVIVEHVFNQIHLHGLITTDWLLAGGRLKRSNFTAEPNQESGARKTHSRPVPRPQWFGLLADDSAEMMDEPLARGGVLTRIRRKDDRQNDLRPCLEVRNLIVRRGSRVVIGLDDQRDESGFNLILYGGEIAILQAPNGWGKTTLMAAIMGLIPIVAGEVFLEGANLARLHPWERVRQGLRALVSGNSTFPSLSAAEALRLSGNPSVPKEIASISARSGSSLSGGEKQRVALACFSAGRVAILDEPWLGLDSSGINAIVSRLILNKKPSESVLILAPNHIDER
jgi:branched-chain amino acid transport system ATP-binding protein